METKSVLPISSVAQLHHFDHVTSDCVGSIFGSFSSPRQDIQFRFFLQLNQCFLQSTTEQANRLLGRTLKAAEAVAAFVARRCCGHYGS